MKSGRRKKLGIVRTSAGVKQIEVMNINSQKQKPIPFLLLLFSLLGGFYFRVERDSSTAQREALAIASQSKREVDVLSELVDAFPLF